MAAGIISACLPTLLPVFLYCGRAFGLTQSALLPRREANAAPTIGGTGGSKDGYRSRSATLSSFTTRTDDDALDNAAENPLCGLRDSAESGGVVSHPVGLRAITTDNASEPSLRTDTLGYGHSATSYTVRRSGNNGDDVPLQGILVQTDFIKSTTKIALS